MNPIERANQLPAQPPSRPMPARPAAPVAQAMAGDRFTSSPAATTAERMREFSRQVESLLALTPRTTAQATAWMERGQALHADAAPRLKNGDLKSLPLKERQQFSINVRRLENLLEDAPGIIRFIAGD